MVITAAYTGTRFSELAALTRGNLHLDTATLHVSATVGALHEVAGHRQLGPPKSPAAVRDIALPPFLIATPIMTSRLLDSLQRRWLENGGHW